MAKGVKLSQGIMNNGKAPIVLKPDIPRAPPTAATTPVRTKRCETCAAFAIDPKQPMGECRAKHPMGVIIPVAAEKLGMGVTTQLSGGWPPVRRTQWCLEWQPAVPEEVDAASDGVAA